MEMTMDVIDKVSRALQGVTAAGFMKKCRYHYVAHGIEQKLHNHKSEHFNFNYCQFVMADSDAHVRTKLLEFMCLLQNASFYIQPFACNTRVEIVEAMFQIFHSSCYADDIKFFTTLEKLMYEDMYRLINCTVRYLQGKAEEVSNY